MLRLRTASTDFVFLFFWLLTSGFWLLFSLHTLRSEDDALDHGVGLLVLMKNSRFVIVWPVSTCGRVTEYDLLKQPV